MNALTATGKRLFLTGDEAVARGALEEGVDVVSEQTGASIFVLSTTAVANAITAMRVGKIEREMHKRPAHIPRNLAKFTECEAGKPRRFHPGDETLP